MKKMTVCLAILSVFLLLGTGAFAREPVAPQGTQHVNARGEHPDRELEKDEKQRLIAAVAEQKLQKALREGTIQLTHAEYYQRFDEEGSSAE